MKFDQYLEKILKNESVNLFPELTGPIIPSFNEAVECCLQYYHTYPVSEHALKSRTCTAQKMKDFHKKAGTYTDSIKTALDTLSNPDALVIEVAHQPNIFPYAGYFKKIVLGHMIAETIREQTNLPVVEIFGIVDQDFASPKWFRNTYLPDINAGDGILALKVQVSKKRIDAMYTIEKPTNDLLNKWKNNLETWLVSNARILNRLHREAYGELKFDRDNMAVFRGRLKQLFGLIDDCAGRSNSLTEFNSFFISTLVNSIWDYPMLFYEYHTTQSCFRHEYEFLANDFERYNRNFNTFYSHLVDNGVSLNFKEVPPDQAPFWFHCDCGAKVEIRAKRDHKDVVLTKSRCEKCNSEPEIIELDNMDNISPRAVSRPIIISKGIQPSIFVSGIGAAGFEMVSRGIANNFNIKLPPYVIWNGNDSYMGIAQKVAEMTKADKKNSNKQRIRCENALNVNPCIIDYLINFGFEETAKLWDNYLIKNGHLNEQVNLE
ncbi:hypothetical protein KA005_65895 [bacterium]|nr:hypothetical protein [bacterium]